jgi:hypothetical protein
MGVKRATAAQTAQRKWFAERRRLAFARVPRAGRRLIIDEPVTFVSRGLRYRGRLSVAQPVVVSKVEARCVVELDGWWPAVALSGNEPLQALILGLRHVGFGLHDAHDKGVRVVGPRGYGNEWAALMLGPLFESAGKALARSKRRERATEASGAKAKRTPARGSRTR